MCIRDRGGTVLVAGTGCTAGTTVPITLSGSGSVGSAVTDPSGAFSTSVTIPSSATPGSHTITVMCGTIAQVLAVVVSATTTGTLPVTGNDPGALLVIAMLTIAAGSALLLSSRRRTT